METNSRIYEKLPNIDMHASMKIQKNEFVKSVWPANSALFIYVSTHCVETVNSLSTIDILSWLAVAVVTHSLWVHDVPGSIPGSGKSFYVIFCFVVVDIIKY